MWFSLFGRPDVALSNQLQLQPLSFFFALVYFALAAWLVYSELPLLRNLRQKSLLTWLACIFASLVLTSVFTIHFPSTSEVAYFYLPLLVGIPVVLCSVVGIFPAVLTGFVAGIFQLIWAPQWIFTPFEMALWGAVAAYLIRQDYRGRFARIVRNPIVAVFLASIVLWGAHGLNSISFRGGYILAAALYCLQPLMSILPYILLRALITGFVVQGVFLTFPSIIPAKKSSRIPPYARSLKSQVLFVSVPSILIVIVVLFWAVNTTAITVAIEQTLAEAARDSENAAERIPFILQTGQALLTQFTEDEGLYSLSAETRQQRLARHIRTMAFFKQLALINGSFEILNYYPAVAGSSPFELENYETVLGERVADSGTFQTSPVHRLDDNTHAISFLAPMLREEGKPIGVLVGRADVGRAPMMRDVLNSLQSTMTTGVGFVVDERGLVIAHPDKGRILSPWTPIRAPDSLLKSSDRVLAYIEVDPSGNRSLVYFSEVAGTTWKTVIYVPYETILNQAGEISTPFVAILLFVGATLIALIPILSSRLTRPIEALAKAAAHIAQGQLDRPIEVAGDNEVGHLGTAFETMRLSLQTRLKELSLLLKVSQAVSANLNLEGNLEPILAGIMEATSATYARIILMSALSVPNRQVSVKRSGPVTWGKVKIFSGPLLRLAKDRRAIKVQDTSVYPGLFVESPGTALGFPLSTKDRLIGVLVVEYRLRGDFPTSELEFLSTLAGQASIAVESARLFEAVESERRRLETILISTNDAIIVTDQNNKILLVNPAAQQAFELKVPDVIGHSALVLSAYPELVDLLIQSAAESNISTREIVLPDGRTLYASASPIGGDSESPQGYVVVMRDITHLKEIDSMKSEFVSTVSHDLRSPLTYMKGYTSLIVSSGTLNEKQDEYIQKIRSGINQMTELIDDLLDIGKIEAGIGVNMIPCPLDTLIRRLAVEMDARAHAKGLDLHLNLSSDLPLIMMDEALIRQAITNLIDNAIKYTVSGFVDVSAYETEKEVVVSVKDSGIGIPTVDLPRLFEKFYRVKTREAMKMRGTGLGLSIVKSIAGLHRGRVWVESELNRGSTFFLALPVSDQG